MRQPSTKPTQRVPYARELDRRARDPKSGEANQDDLTGQSGLREKASASTNDLSRGPFDIVFAVGISIILWILLLWLGIYLFR